jgi:hypothetical protein
VLLRKIATYGDPRLFALERVAANLAQSTQPLVLVVDKRDPLPELAIAVPSTRSEAD